MNNDTLKQVVFEALEKFYAARLAALKKLKLRDLLKKRNPYLFRALGHGQAGELVARLLESHIWSSDETIFGNAFFEPVANAVSGGVMSPSAGVDIAVETAKRYKAIAVKSGPNWGNSDQWKKLNQNFLSLRSRLQKSGKQFDALVGAGYGRRSIEPSENHIYRMRCGQAFWEELTGDPEFYLRLLRLIGEHPLDHHKVHREAWDAAVNRFTLEFIQDFGLTDGAIDWDRLLQFNSGKDSIKLPRTASRKKQKKNGRQDV